MVEEPQGNPDGSFTPEETSGSSVWKQVMDTVAQRFPAGAVDTWFRPIRLVARQDSRLLLEVPTEAFRSIFVDHYAAVLGNIVDEVVGSHLELQIVAQSNDEPSHATDLLPVMHASALDSRNGQTRWLIEHLWTAAGVGILAGQPKSLKTYVALEMAVSVASGSPCFGVFPVSVQGPTLVYAAEDAPSDLRSRLESLAAQRDRRLEDLDLRVITADFIRLDHPQDQERLRETVLRYRPMLLVLDPLVRLHSQDENQSGPMAALLGYLRRLQRSTGTAVLIVHHLRKSGNASGAGYNLRGSSDLYAWVDSFVSLQRCRDRITISAEHRAATPLKPVPVELVHESQGRAPWLRITTPDVPLPETNHDLLRTRLLDLLGKTAHPLKTDEIRQKLQVRKHRVTSMLKDLCEEGLVVRLPGGYRASMEQLDRGSRSAL
ncbi:MAG: hypothetical protein H6Q05_3865 [Acidobacteria bacterium]|nr:hypothetical protein [Acidobacteriota bacterium]